MQSPIPQFARAYANSAWVRLAVAIALSALGVTTGALVGLLPDSVQSPTALVLMIGISGVFAWVLVE